LPRGASFGFGPGAAFVLLVALGAAAFWYFRRRHPVLPRRRGAIVIEDTRPLGNRQFLVVASCDGRRFLLGVAQGGIRLISPLESEPLEDDPDAHTHA